MATLDDSARCATWTCEHVVLPADGGSGSNITRVGFRCPRCGRVSWNREDLAHGYCGNCRAWTTEPHPSR